MRFILVLVALFHFHHTINLISFPSLTNISGFRNTTAQIWFVPTGCPSLRRCSRRKLICSAKVSAVMPQPSVERRYTIASSTLILDFHRLVLPAKNEEYRETQKRKQQFRSRAPSWSGLYFSVHNVNHFSFPNIAKNCQLPTILLLNS